MQFYRYVLEDVSESLGTLVIPGVKVNLQEYNLVKETPKGYWINIFNTHDGLSIWISKTSRKRFAYPTRMEALFSFKMRTQKRLKIARLTINLCEQALKQVENF